MNNKRFRNCCSLNIRSDNNFKNKSYSHAVQPETELTYYLTHGDNTTEPLDQYSIFDNDKTIRFAINNQSSLSNTYVSKDGGNISTLENPQQFRKNMGIG